MSVNFADGVKALLEPIDTVRQHPRNANNGDVENLMESIQVNGFYTAITAIRSTGEIVAGNHRYQALLGLGATEIPVIWLDKDATGALRVLVTDNESSRMAQMDKAGQLALLQDLAESEIGLMGTGFDEDKMELLLQQVAEDAEAPIGEGQGFGAGEAPSGLYQVVIDFYEAEAERDDLFAELVDRAELDGRVRTVNL